MYISIICVYIYIHTLSLSLSISISIYIYICIYTQHIHFYMSVYAAFDESSNLSRAIFAEAVTVDICRA